MPENLQLIEQKLHKRNEEYIERFKNSEIMMLVLSNNINKQEVRDKLLDCIQLFSNYFQKMVMTRYITTDDRRFFDIVEAHLNEEFGHNQALMKERENKPPAWDPILEAAACWFCWKMLVLDNIDKTLMMHLVLEASAEIFFKAAHQALKPFGETNYFSLHDSVDEQHASMAGYIFSDLREDEYLRLFALQDQAWEMMITACNRIASLSNEKASL